MPLQIGIDFEEFEKLSRPPLIPDGTYEFMVDSRCDETTTAEGRPMWVFYLKIINNPTVGDRSIRYSCLLPWIDPVKNTWDYSATFAIVDLINGTDMVIRGKELPDKEAFFGRTGVMKVGHKARKGEEDVVDNTAKIVTKRKGSRVS